MEIKQTNTKLIVNGIEVRQVSTLGVSCFVVVDGTRVKYFDSIAEALNSVTAMIACHPENKEELANFVSRK